MHEGGGIAQFVVNVVDRSRLSHALLDEFVLLVGVEE